MKSSIFKKHDKFVKDMKKRMITSSKKKTEKDNYTFASDFERELEAKFNELFGDDNEDE